MTISSELAEYRRLKIRLMTMRMALLGAILVLTIYWAFTEQGLIGVLLDLQLRWFNWASTKISILIGMVGLAIPAFLVLETVMRPFNRRLASLEQRLLSTGELTAAEAAGVAPGDINRDPGEIAASRLRNIRKWAFVALLAGIVVIGASIGANVYRDVLFRPNPEAYRPEQIDLSTAGDRGPTARFAVVTGVAIPRAAYGWREGGTGGRHYRAVPLVPPNWGPGEPVRFFVLVREAGEDARHPYHTSVDGEITVNGLPTFVTSAYTREKIAIANPHYVVRPGQYGPETDWGNWILGGGLGGAILVVIGLMLLLATALQSRLLRRRSQGSG